MPRPRSEHVTRVKRQLAARLAGGVAGPGERFLSNRAVAEQFGVSYQTAHRLLAELEREGLLSRRSASGSYVPGTRAAYDGVQLVLNPRVRRKASFGARLQAALGAALDRERVDWRVTYARPGGRPPVVAAARYPVVWECPDVVAALAATGRAGLVLNDRPPPGLGGLRLDSVGVDDFAGGGCAADLLLRARDGDAAPRRSDLPRLAVLSGPAGDARSDARVAGFRSAVGPRATVTVIASADWFATGGRARAADVVAAGSDGIFCCNDRLAEAVLRWCREAKRDRPPVVGFDDAPIAGWLELTTIAIPWQELTAAVASLVRRRLAGDASTAAQVVLTPRPVARRL